MSIAACDPDMVPSGYAFRERPVYAEVRGLEVGALDVAAHSETDLGPIMVQLHQPDEAADVIGGETGTIVKMQITPMGLLFIRYENDYGDELTRKFVPWRDLLPPYQDPNEMPPAIVAE